MRAPTLHRKGAQRLPPPSPHAQYGTPSWFDQHDALCRLSLQAHANACAHADEYVAAAIVAADGAVTLLVCELLAAEVSHELGGVCGLGGGQPALCRVCVRQGS